MPNGNTDPMRRYRIETWDATRSRCLSVTRCSWPVLARANADDPDLVGDCLALPVGEEWAGNFGFDTDSRKAEHIYHECVATGRALSRLLTHPEMDRLRDLLADY